MIEVEVKDDLIYDTHLRFGTQVMLAEWCDSFDPRSQTLTLKKEWHHQVIMATKMVSFINPKLNLSTVVPLDLIAVIRDKKSRKVFYQSNDPQNIQGMLVRSPRNATLPDVQTEHLDTVVNLSSTELQCQFKRHGEIVAFLRITYEDKDIKFSLETRDSNQIRKHLAQYSLPIK